MTTLQSPSSVHLVVHAACTNLPLRAECKHRNWYRDWRADTVPKIGGRIRRCKECRARVYEPGLHDGVCPGCGR